MHRITEYQTTQSSMIFFQKKMHFSFFLAIFLFLCQEEIRDKTVLVVKNWKEFKYFNLNTRTHTHTKSVGKVSFCVIELSCERYEKFYWIFSSHRSQASLNSFDNDSYFAIHSPLSQKLSFSGNLYFSHRLLLISGRNEKRLTKPRKFSNSLFIKLSVSRVGFLFFFSVTWKTLQNKHMYQVIEYMC